MRVSGIMSHKSFIKNLKYEWIVEDVIQGMELSITRWVNNMAGDYLG